MSVELRLLAAGYTQEQVDSVMGTNSRETKDEVPEMKCEDCLYAERWHQRHPCNRCSGNAFLIIKNHFAPKAPVETGNDWLSIDTIPVDRYVEVKTVTGLIRVAKPRCGTRWFRRADKYGPKRVECFCKNASNVWATAWREP